MSSVKIILKKNKINSKGEAPLYIRIIKNRKTKFISLGVKILIKDWNERQSRVRKSHPNSQRMNNFIAHKVAEAEGVALEMEADSKYVSPKSIKDNIMGTNPHSFLQYFSEYIDTLEKSGKFSYYKKSKTVFTKLSEYVGDKKITFNELTVTFLKRYERYLSENLGNSINTIHSNMKVIRKVINDAINEDILPYEKSPFHKYKLKLEKTTKEFLTEDEIRRFEELQLEKNSMRNHHRNIYVFATYAGGLRISDIFQLRWSDYDGERILMTTKKTKSTVSIKLPNKAKEIIKKYKTEDAEKEHYIFPFLKNDIEYSESALFRAISSHTAYTNTDLKKIAKLAGIDKNIHFHTSRHTFATRALKKGMRIEYVSRLLGHSSIKTTQVYAKIVNQDLDDAMDKFFD
ncbi:MAG: site-specific integrase [Bacteroidales bacterium]|nr:site-specific integrase [Bacteroidales bacterium]